MKYFLFPDLPVFDIDIKHGFQIRPDLVGKLELLRVPQVLAYV
jgi:hypothetical protein